MWEHALRGTEGKARRTGAVVGGAEVDERRRHGPAISLVSRGGGSFRKKAALRRRSGGFWGACLAGSVDMATTTRAWVSRALEHWTQCTRVAGSRDGGSAPPLGVRRPGAPICLVRPPLFHSMSDVHTLNDMNGPQERGC